jgi:hypothetical protein
VPRGLTKSRKRVQASAGTIFPSGNLWIFPATREKSHAFQSRKGAVQRPIRCQESGVIDVLQEFRHLIPMEVLTEIARHLAHGEFERQELSGFSSHRRRL